jgi:hypothetical protein
MKYIHYIIGIVLFLTAVVGFELFPKKMPAEKEALPDKQKDHYDR